MIGTKFHEWAMSELRLARKDAIDQYANARGIADVEAASSKCQTEIIDLAEKIICMFHENEQGPIVSYAAINIVKTLIDREPLTPVTDESDQWNMVKWNYTDNDKNLQFEHKRNPSLFKTIMEDCSVWFTDIDRVHYANVREDDTDFSYSNVYLTRLIDTIYHPIAFPYTSEEIRVKIDRLDGDEIREDLPTIVEVISYSVNNGPFEKIGRYYRYNAKTNKWDEISPFVYVNHKNVIEMTRKIYDEYDAVKKGCPCCED